MKLTACFCFALGLLDTALSAALKPTALDLVPRDSFPNSFTQGLRSKLSPGASVTKDTSVVLRWSSYNAPTPGLVVNVATEKDVQATVQYCVQRGVPFMAKNGGHGWIDRFNLTSNGLVINLRGLNKTTISSDKKSATVQGGAHISEVIDATYNADTQIVTGNCNCVGLLGAALGGGYGNLMGQYGFSVDVIQSMNVVLADGSAVTVTAKSNPDLWFALRGAAPNFGIVTSAIFKTSPLPKAQNTAWLGGLTFSEKKLEKVVQAIQDLTLGPNMSLFLYFFTAGAPSYDPIISVNPFYFGSEAEGRAAFKSLLDIGPIEDTTAVLPKNQWNARGDAFCEKGQRKPTYGAGLNSLSPKAFRSIYDLYKDFVKTTGAGGTTMIVECFSLGKGRTFDAKTASFGNRDIRFNSLMAAIYDNTTLDDAAVKFGSKVRDLWWASDGIDGYRTYPNFARGDETTEALFGQNAPRLKALKKQYDPKNVMNHFLPIKAN